MTHEVHGVANCDDHQEAEEDPQDDVIGQGQADASTEHRSTQGSARQEDQGPRFWPRTAVKASVDHDGHRHNQHHQTKARADGSARR